ncbi:MAG TPA: hypothetical protein VHP31_08850 [Caproicibacter sp.]|nr:hypothetical protein [Caproicibacter sp.]
MKRYYLAAVVLAILLSLSACSVAYASKTVNAQPTASGTVSTVSKFSSSPAKSTPSSETAVSAVTGVVPKTFKAKKIVRTFGYDRTHTYSVYFPSDWNMSDGFIYIGKEAKNWIGWFDQLDYATNPAVWDVIGMHAEFITDNESAIPGMQNCIVEELIKRINCPLARSQGDNTVIYELHYIIYSGNGKIVNDLCFRSKKMDEIPDDDEKIVLQKIYENTGLNDEMVQEILHSYSET